VADLEQIADHIVVGYFAAAIFATPDRDRHRLRNRAYPHFAVHRDRAVAGSRYRNIDLPARHRHRNRDRHHAAGFLVFTDGIFDARAIASDHMHGPIDDSLRRIDVAIAAHMGISSLTRAEARIGER